MLRKRRSRFKVVMIVVALAACGILWASARTYLSCVAYWCTKVTGLGVTECVIAGRMRTTQDDIWQAIGVAWYENVGAYAIDAMRHRLEELPWVKQAVVMRRFPQTFVIHLQEHVPLAIWQHNGRKALLSEEGEVIQRVSPDTTTGYMVVTGEKAPKYVQSLLHILAGYRQHLPKVVAAAFLRSNRWDIYFQDGTRIKLPEHNIPEALERLIQVLAWQARSGEKVKAIDLRFLDAVMLEVLPPSSHKSAGKEAQKKRVAPCIKRIASPREQKA